MTTLVCSPHPDDEMIGMGGTIAKLAKEGERVVVCIFTLGEMGNPWQRPEAITKTRREEALAAGEIAGTARTVFLELDDLKISTEVVEKDVASTMKDLLDEEAPDTIFIPAVDDIHGDHRAVARFVLSVHEEHETDADVWMYTVWNPLHIKHRSQPKLVMDITKEFRTKWKAIQTYQSQKVSTFQLIPTVVLRGFLHGIRHGHHMAEVFLKAR